jgi:misacylated tRNA(Ala) deacylase
MTERLYLDASQAQTTDAIVLGADPAGIVLDRTVFYARSGGQPGDVGVLNWAGGTCAIADTIKGDGETILHIPAESAALPPVGATVQAVLDWPARQRLMRMHSALHLLCAVLPGVAVTGGQIGPERSRLDFNMPEPPDKQAIETALNALIAADHPISSEWVDESVLDTNPEMVRTLSVKPPRGTGRLRLVRIGAGATPIDLQPCGGTHVTHTGEIGAMTIAKIENKGKMNRRIVLVPTS